MIEKPAEAGLSRPSAPLESTLELFETLEEYVDLLSEWNNEMVEFFARPRKIAEQEVTL